MATRLTRNIQLRLTSGLTTDGEYNLNRLDAVIGNLPFIALTDAVKLRSRADIYIEAENADVGGAGNAGTIYIGDPTRDPNDSGRLPSDVVITANAFRVTDSSATETDTDVLTVANTKNVKNKTISGALNTLSNIAESSVLLAHTTADLYALAVTAQQSADDARTTADGAASAIASHVANVTNPHSVTLAQVLGHALITNTDVASNAAIAESKLALDHSTSTLNTAINTKQVDIGATAPTSADVGGILQAIGPGQCQWATGGVGGSTVKITLADTLAGVLDDKLVSGDGLVKATLNAGAVEQLEFSVDPDLLPLPELTDVGKALVATAAGEAAWTLAVLTDEKVKASATDTTPGHVTDKLVAGHAVELTLKDVGGNESVEVAVDATLLPSPEAADVNKALVATAEGAADWVAISFVDDKVKSSSSDSTADYLINKITNGAGINISEVNVAGVKHLEVENSDGGDAAVGTHESTYGHANIPSAATEANKVWSTASSTTPGWNSVADALGYTPVDTDAVGALNGVAPLDEDGFVPLANIPPAALERIVVVADEAARYDLTTADVQNGDVVRQTDTNVMWYVSDDTHLDSAAGYTEFAAGTAAHVAWTGITSMPSSVDTLGDVTAADTGLPLVATGNGTADFMLDPAVSEYAQTGIITFDPAGSGDFWSYASGTFTVLRPGTGRVKAKAVSWAANASVSGLLADHTYYICVDANGAFSAIDAVALISSNRRVTIENFYGVFSNYIVLFAVWTDSTTPLVTRMCPAYTANVIGGLLEYFKFGQIFTYSGGILSALSASGRTLQSSGEDLIAVSCITGRIPDSVGVAVVNPVIYRNTSGVARRLSRHAFTVTGVIVAPIAGTVYSHNGSEYTVFYVDLVGGTGTIHAWMSTQINSPLSGGTLTKVSGTGDTAIAFSAVVPVMNIPSAYLLSSVPTLLGTSGSTRYGICAVYVIRDDIQTPSVSAPTPRYITLMSNAAYVSASAAANSIGTALAPDVSQFIMPSELLPHTPSLNGFVIVDGSTRSISTYTGNGFIAGVRTAKATAASGSSAGAVAVAAATNVSTDVTGFTGALSSADSNVQLALNTLGVWSLAHQTMIDATTSWTDDTTDYYITVPAATHRKGTRPKVQVLGGVSSPYTVLAVETWINSSGDVTIKVPNGTPDERFYGLLSIS